MGDGNRSRVLVTGGSGFTQLRVARALTAPFAHVSPLIAGCSPAFAQVCGPGMAEKDSSGPLVPGISRARWIGFTPEHDLKSGLATIWPEFAEAAQ